jgi:putative ABC transport system substrate-binding protein
MTRSNVDLHAGRPPLSPGDSRRTFLLTVSSCLLAAPRAGYTQPLKKVVRVGWLSTAQMGAPTANTRELFREGLRDAGWFEGRNLVIEFREGPLEGTVEHRLSALGELAKELVNLKADVIVAWGGAAAIGAKRIVQTVPVVFASVADPVAMGLVASLSRPGGNFTGVANLTFELQAKRLDLLKEMVPGLRKVGVLILRDNPYREPLLKALHSAAQAINIGFYIAETGATDPLDLDRAFAAMASAGAGAVVSTGALWYLRHRHRVADLALKHRLATSFDSDLYAEAGCLMSYVASHRDIIRLGATYVDRILKGASPQDLPVQQPTKFELVLNAKTAKALGLTLPGSLLLRADRVIDP